jgi:Caspase domain
MAFADRALVVGINVYPGMTPLAGAEGDALDFYAWVTSPSGGVIDKQNATLFISSQFPAVASVDDAQPAKEKIERFFTTLANDADANGNQKAGKRLWMFFSGHGFAPTGLRSGVLMANATPRLAHNVSAEWWAERLSESGYFDEVILFQDACRQIAPTADLTPPFLVQSRAPVQQNPLKFCAFAAKNGKLALEKPFPDGRVHGVFTFALMQGLNGKGCDDTGAVTTESLREYLLNTMRTLLSADDVRNPQIAQQPEVSGSDRFVLVPAAAPITFPVQITVKAPGQSGLITDGRLQTVAKTPAVPALWTVSLPRGLYKATIIGSGAALFEVTGQANPDHSVSIVNVSV